MSCLSKLLLHELWPKQLRERFIIVAKLYIFFVEEAGQLFEVFHIHPTCYSMLHNMYTLCPHIFNGSSTSETTNFVSY